MRRGVLAGRARIAIALGVVLVALTGAGAASAATFTPVCSAAPVHFARCFSLTLTGSRTPFAIGSPSGLGANDLQDAYKLPSASAGSGQTIAIVDAFDDTTAVSEACDSWRETGVG